MAIQAPGMSVDVQDRLMQRRRRKRALGAIPYPVVHTKAQATFDDWNYFFCRKLYGHPSIHVFSTPPAKVLDLGCGTGLWVLEAAKYWPTTHFVGFDVARSQPPTQWLDSEIPDAARRIRWTHGNILDPLPFAPEAFDFVRISGVGLGVPEDEWQDLFQEVARIMKPNAILEIMEEDLLFPSGNTPKPRDVRPVIPPEARRDPPFTLALSKAPSIASSVSPGRTPAPLPTKSPRRTPQPLKEPQNNSSASVGSNVSTVSSQSAGEPDELDFELLLDPRDHSKLKQAWNGMLDKRFLTSGLLAVLPFYLSAEFVDVQIKTALNVPLPANSVYVLSEDEVARSPMLLPARSRSNTLRSIMSVRQENVAEVSPNANPNEVLAADCASNYRARSRSVTTSSWASMHLAKTVSLLQGCKEAIWEEYSKFGCTFTSKAPISLVREEFLAAWSNWESDMKNRMGMRGNMPRFASWTPAFPKDDPEWRAWRARKAVWDFKDDDAPLEPQPVELCRSLRGFVARKPCSPAQA